MDIWTAIVLCTLIAGVAAVIIFGGRSGGSSSPSTGSSPGRPRYSEDVWPGARWTTVEYTIKPQIVKDAKPSDADEETK